MFLGRKNKNIRKILDGEGFLDTYEISGLKKRTAGLVFKWFRG